MSDTKEFDAVLDSCLSKLFNGVPLKECLEDYPGQAEALRPLLETATVARKALDFKASPGFKSETRRQLLTILASMKQRKAGPGASWLEVFRARWAAAGVSLALAILMAGGGLMAASGDSLPGDFLYGFKLAAEQAMLSFSLSDEARAETYARLADRRVEEIVQLAARADTAHMEETTRRLGGYLSGITAILSPTFSGDGDAAPSAESDPRDVLLNGQQDKYGESVSEITLLLQQYGLKQVEALEQALETAPQESKEALEQALAVTLAGYQSILSAAD